MDKRRFFFIAIVVFVLNAVATGGAIAGFGFGSDDLGKSGLDFNKGYDVNTVTSVSGRVLSSPHTDDKGLVFVDMKAGGEAITLSLGPKSTWDKRQIPLRPNDEVSAKGSRAQGKDGKTYLLVQKISNVTTGGQSTVRNQHGGPPWVGNNGGMMSGGSGGQMMRSGGMMRR